MPRSAGLSYLLAALALGLIAVWGSESLFWSAPQPGLTALDLCMTVLAYSVCVAACLSAVLLTGVSGWQALFLGGALMGWLVEGVIVGTMYDAFPFQLVWTPLAWHALITGLLILGLCRAGVHWSLPRQLAALVALGVAAAFFAQYWPKERGAMPGLPETFVYIAGLGLVVPLANLGLDRIGRLTMPPRWLLWTPATLLAVLWIVQGLLAPTPIRLVLPALLGLTVWVMRRLGRGPHPIDFGRPAPVWRHALMLVPAVLMPVLSVPGWAHWQGFGAEMVVAGISVPVSLGLWMWLTVRAMRLR